MLRTAPVVQFRENTITNKQPLYKYDIGVLSQHLYHKYVRYASTVNSLLLQPHTIYVKTQLIMQQRESQD